MGVTARQAALVAGLLAAVVAAPSIRNGFAADDRWIIAERPLLQHPPSLGAVLQEPYWPAGFGGSLWRPVVLASYALDYRLGGSPHWFHAVNVFWAAVATAVLTLLACRLADPTIGLVTGLLFAVHPVHVEAIANVVGRAELMAGAGYAAALLFALSERRAVQAIGVALCAAFAIGSKELAATLPASIVLVYVARGGRSNVRAALRPAAAALLPIVGYYVAHASVGAGILGAGGTAPGLEGLGLLQRAWAMLPLTLEWWRLLLVPIHLASDYSPAELIVTTRFTLGHVVGALVWVGAGGAAWRWGRTLPGAALGLAWMIITVSPVANIVVPTELLVAERTLYLPSFGLVFGLASLGVGWVASSWPVRWRVVLAALIVVLGAGRSIAREGVWRDDETLFQAAKRDAPRSYRTLWMVGKDEFQAGRWGSGERLLREAIDAAPAVVGPRFDLARFYWDAKLWKPAAEQLTAATAIDSAFVPAWRLLPGALLAEGDTVRAGNAARSALRLFPDDPDIKTSATAVLSAGHPR